MDSYLPSSTLGWPEQTATPFAAPLDRNNNCGYGILMTINLKVRKVGNSLGIVLPKEALARLKVEEGDTLTLSEAQDGVRLSATNPEFAKTMAVFESLSRRYRNTLRELAK
jgi:putative addiction module antidote